MSTLYLVATPIGNLRDITLRALDVLRSVAWIAAEDTRRTRILLQHYDIPAGSRLLSFHEHNKARRIPQLVQRLDRGEDGALVSDAGTPVLHDPGLELVQAVWQAGHRVVPVPGPSAVVAALAASGFPAERFLFLGYLPRNRAARRQRLEEVAALPYTLVAFEVPHRLVESLEDLVAVLGDQRRAVIARELTKVHETFHRGTLGQLLALVRQQPLKGEMTLVIQPPEGDARWPLEALDAAIREGLAQGESPSALARRLAQASGWPRQQVYRRILEHRGQG